MVQKNLALTKACCPIMKFGVDASSIGQALVTELSLGDGSLEFLVKFVEIDN